MLGKIFGALCIVSLICAAITGNLTSLGAAAAQGAASAVTVSLGLLGAMALWNGIMRVLDTAGATKALAKLTAPVLRFVFPDAYRKGRGIPEITAAVTANMLGLGNAATPLSISAMQALAENGGDEVKLTGRATDEMVTFVVLSTASLDIIPTTLLALRSAAGSASPEAVLVPVWICSGVCACAAVLFSKLPPLIGRLFKSACNIKAYKNRIGGAPS